MLLTQHGIDSLPRRGPIDQDIILLQDWVTPDIGVQPSGSLPAPAPYWDPDGPLDVTGTGWAGTPYVRTQEIGWADVKVPPNGSSTDFYLYALEGIVYNQGLSGYSLGSQDVDFTIEAWMRYSAARGNLSYYRGQPLLGLFSPSSRCCFGVWDNGVGYWDDSGRRISQYGPLEGWHHYAIVKHGPTVNMYVDGSYFGSNYELTPGVIDTFAIAKRGYIYWAGTRIDMARYDFAQVCVTRRAKWLGEFTPPTTPYCLGA